MGLGFAIVRLYYFRLTQTIKRRLDLINLFSRPAFLLFHAVAISCFSSSALLFSSPLLAEQVAVKTVVPAQGEKHNALSLTGTPKYGPQTKHFDYVNPEAPNGGTLRLSAIGTFDNLNPFTIKGNAANGLLLTYDQLMEPSLDEGSTEYCLLCEWVSYPEDFSSVTFKLRQGPKFHDGTPIGVNDVIFSMFELKKANPRYGQYYKNVVRAEKTGPDQVTFYFDVKNNRELPLIVGQLPILPKHYWMGKNKKGEPRDLSKTTLEAPLGSGPYRIGPFKTGQSFSLSRVDDYWGQDHYVRKGQYNFQTLKFEYFRDSTIAFEAFKTGSFDYYTETSSLNWARNYNFSAVKEGRVIRRDDIKLKNPEGMQGFVFNTRRPKFADARVREAISRVFNFEWAAKNLFYNQYQRTSSFFENSELASSGAPSPAELALLTPLKKDIPPAVLDQAFAPFQHLGSSGSRKQLRAAKRLMKAAGWTIPRGEKFLRDKNGRLLEIEFLIVSPAFQRVLQAYLPNLTQLGVKASIRLVDVPQYQKRLETFKFDMIVGSWGQSDSPGNEQRYFWGSKAATMEGSRNYAGIQNPAVDALIDHIIFAKNRPDLVTATRALDRVLLFNHYVVPHWHAAYERIAYWNKFGQPKVQASRSVGAVALWWYDQEKAKALH